MRIKYKSSPCIQDFVHTSGNPQMYGRLQPRTYDGSRRYTSGLVGRQLSFSAHPGRSFHHRHRRRQSIPLNIGQRSRPATHSAVTGSHDYSGQSALTQPPWRASVTPGTPDYGTQFVFFQFPYSQATGQYFQAL